MAGTTNQIQTPFGTGVKTALGLEVGTAGGITQLPANPNVSVTGTLYGGLFSVWKAANIINGGAFSTPYIVANYNSMSASGNGVALPTITALDFGDIQILRNNFTGSQPTFTSVTANSLFQLSGDFNFTGAAVTSLSMPALQYVGGRFTSNFALLTTLSMPALLAINGQFDSNMSSITTVSMPLLSYVGSNLSPTFANATSFDFSSLQYCSSSISMSAATVTTLSFPALISVGQIFSITAANLVTFSIGSTLKSIGSNFTMTGMKLDQASVDGILVSLAALDGTNGTTAYSSKTVNLSGGTSAAPSATGLTAKATLQARSCTVTTN